MTTTRARRQTPEERERAAHRLHTLRLLLQGSKTTCVLQHDLESRRAPLLFRRDERIAVPCGVLHLPKEEPMPATLRVERAYNVVRWTEKPRGSHFAAWEEPEMFATDVRGFVGPVSKASRCAKARDYSENTTDSQKPDCRFPDTL